MTRHPRAATPAAPAPRPDCHASGAAATPIRIGGTNIRLPAPTLRPVLPGTPRAGSGPVREPGTFIRVGGTNIRLPAPTRKG